MTPILENPYCDSGECRVLFRKIGKNMKLNETRPYMESSGGMEEQFFSVQDQGMIFDILRNKMYSNPILAICREISCNARDAHREVGLPDLPVEISLPNHLEPLFKIKDFGPGISTDRMSNIFIKYTASTKRSDNIQTGGFGLGAKTPFSYSDSFSIVTNHNGIQYNYSCNIDETKVGKLSLLSQVPTKEKNGTEIIIPVKPKNFQEFATWTEQACRHWSVKPTIRGGFIKWQETSKILEGDKWAITQSSDYQRNAKMVIDGIEYPLELDTLRKYADSQLIDAAKGNFVMYFDIGELSLSASRESIYLDEKTQSIIRGRLKVIQSEIKKRVVEKIDSFDNLYLAHLYYHKELIQAFNNIHFLGPLSWRGSTLQKDYLQINCPVFTFIRGKFSRKHGTDPNKLSRSHGTNIVFTHNTEIYVNDLGLKEPTPRHVKKAFDDDTTLQTLMVICPNDSTSIADLNKSIALDQMAPKLLSTITKVSRGYTSSSSRLIIFKFDVTASAFRQVSYSFLEEDTNEKILCLLNKQTSYSNSNVHREPILKGKGILNIGIVRSLAAAFPKISFYGVDMETPSDRLNDLNDEFSDLTDIESFIKEKVTEDKTTNFAEIKFASKHNYYIHDKILSYYNEMKLLIQDPNSLCLKRFELHRKIRSINEDGLDRLNLYEIFNGDITDKDLEKFVLDNPNFDVDAVNAEYLSKYPLMAYMNIYDFGQILDHIAQYINLIDKI